MEIEYSKVTKLLAYVSATIFLLAIALVPFVGVKGAYNYNLIKILSLLTKLNALAIFEFGIIVLITSSIIYMSLLTYQQYVEGSKKFLIIILIVDAIILTLYLNLLFL